MRVVRYLYRLPLLLLHIVLMLPLTLLAINVDTEQEASYLRSLAAGLKLDPATVARLHELTGAPRI